VEVGKKGKGEETGERSDEKAGREIARERKHNVELNEKATCREHLRITTWELWRGLEL
jgi:hypothetical protein